MVAVRRRCVSVPARTSCNPGFLACSQGRAAAFLRRRGVVVVVSSRVGKCNHARVCYRGSRRGQQRRETRRHRGCRSSSPRSRGPHVLVPDVSRMQRPRGTAPSSRTRLVPRWCLAGAARRCNALHVRCMRLAHESHSSSTDRGLMTTAHARRYRRRACALRAICAMPSAPGSLCLKRLTSWLCQKGTAAGATGCSQLHAPPLAASACVLGEAGLSILCAISAPGGPWFCALAGSCHAEQSWW
jgi:hypothetical protein